jgi:hypothetical protein
VAVSGRAHTKEKEKEERRRRNEKGNEERRGKVEMKGRIAYLRGTKTGP